MAAHRILAAAADQRLHQLAGTDEYRSNTGDTYPCDTVDDLIRGGYLLVAESVGCVATPDGYRAGHRIQLTSAGLVMRHALASAGQVR